MAVKPATRGHKCTRLYTSKNLTRQGKENQKAASFTYDRQLQGLRSQAIPPDSKCVLLQARLTEGKRDCGLYGIKVTVSTAAQMQKGLLAIINSPLTLDSSNFMLSPSILSAGKCIKGSLSRYPVIFLR